MCTHNFLDVDPLDTHHRGMCNSFDSLPEPLGRASSLDTRPCSSNSQSTRGTWNSRIHYEGFVCKTCNVASWRLTPDLCWRRQCPSTQAQGCWNQSHINSFPEFAACQQPCPRHCKRPHVHCKKPHLTTIPHHCVGCFSPTCTRNRTTVVCKSHPAASCRTTSPFSCHMRRKDDKDYESVGAHSELSCGQLRSCPAYS